MLLTRPEDQLVLCAVRASFDAQAKEQIRDLLRSELDWLYLLTTANRQGVVPLLEKNLADCEVPPDIAEELRMWKQEILTFNLFLGGELIKLLDLLEAHGVNSIPFKGPTLTLQAYGDVGLRQYKDLDLLIRKDQVETVCRLLRGEGFSPTTDLTPATTAASLRFGCALTFTDARNVIVDVHWNVAERHFGMPISTGDFWTRLEPVKLGNRTLLTLSAEDLLLVLCTHGYAHSWDRLAWICDVAVLVERRTNLDWAYVFDRARHSGVLRILLLGLSLARDLLHVTLPPNVDGEMEQDGVVLGTARKTMAKLFAPHNHSGALGLLSQHLSMRERTRDKLRSLVAMIVMPREYDWVFVSAPTPLYYLVRPLRWAATRLGTQRTNARNARD